MHRIASSKIYSKVAHDGHRDSNLAVPRVRRGNISTDSDKSDHQLAAFDAPARSCRGIALRIPEVLRGPGSMHTRNDGSGACFADLPKPLLEQILQDAFHGMDSGLLPWLRLSGVCRSWMWLMLHQPVQLAFDDTMTEDQADWLAETWVPLQSVSFYRGPPAEAVWEGRSVRMVHDRGDALPRPTPGLEVVQNMCIAGSPCCLSRCSSLREASLRLQCSPSRIDDVLAQLPPSLESLTVNITIGNLSMAAISHLTRLRALTVDVDPSNPNFKFRVLPTPQPPPLRQLTISVGDSKDLWFSCPALAPGAVVQLSTNGSQLALTQAPGHLGGCRLELSVDSVMIAYDGQANDSMPRGGVPDLMDHFLCWMEDSGAACVMLQPYCGFEESDDDDEEDDEEFERCFFLEVNSGDKKNYSLESDPDGTTEFIRELQTHCVRHRFRFSQSSNDQSVLLTRLT